MSALALRNVCKQYPGDVCVVKDFTLDIREGEFVILVGPSGCGKSTTLRMIAGLEEITSGELWMDGTLMNYMEPGKRQLSMVFQNYALYPNMTVYGNLAFSLKVKKVPKKEIDRRVKETAQMLGLEKLLDRRPSALSGGQKQRVAIGSAVLCSPKLFLMDEPLSNLDAKLRTQMRVELGKLHRRLGATMIYVTHDQTEAMTLGTRIVVMRDGVIQQAAPPQELYQHPVNRFVAGFIGSPAMNFAEAKIVAGAQLTKGQITVGAQAAKEQIVDGAQLVIGDGDRQVVVPLPEELRYRLRSRDYSKSRVILGIRPEDVYTECDLQKRNRMFQTDGPGIRVRITASERLGVETMLYFQLQGKQFCARVSPENTACVGDSLTVWFDPARLYLFDTDTEETLN